MLPVRGALAVAALDAMGSYVPKLPVNISDDIH
jgi:hypothetical protein